MGFELKINGHKVNSPIGKFILGIVVFFVVAVIFIMVGLLVAALLGLLAVAGVVLGWIIVITVAIALLGVIIHLIGQRLVTRGRIYKKASSSSRPSAKEKRGN